jgi:hypothetical protein
MKLFLRSPIPNNSTLTARVTSPDGPPGNFVAEGVLRRQGNIVVQWNNAQLRAGVNQQLTPPGSYTGEIVLTFASKSTARLEMEILKPDGTKFVYDERVTRPAGVDVTDLMLPVT